MADFLIEEILTEDTKKEDVVMKKIVPQIAARTVGIFLAVWIVASYVQVINSNIKPETSGMLASANFFAVADSLV